MAGKADEARLALLLGLVQRLDDAPLGVGEFRVVVEAHAVYLPQVEAVGLEAAQRFVEHLHGQVGAAAVGADLGHEENLFAPTLEGPPHPVLGPAVPVLPAIVAEGDPGIDGLVREADGLFYRLEVAEVMAADSQGRHLLAGTTQRSPRDLVRVCHDRLPRVCTAL